MKGAVKIHSMESKTITPICFRFQVNKCTFGDKCKYRHIKDPNFTPRDNKEIKDNNGADQKKFTPKMPNKKFTPNNNNRLVGPPREKSLDEQAPTYLTMQIRTLKLLANVNTVKSYPDHVQNNTPEFMTALFNIGRLWLGAATLLPPMPIHDLDSTGVHDPDNFGTFRPKCPRYNPPGAPGSYVSKLTSHTSHMKLIIRIRKDATHIDTAFLKCAVLLDFMAYISYVISKQHHNSDTMVDVSIIRVRVWKDLSWAANFVDNAIVPDLP